MSSRGLEGGGGLPTTVAVAVLVFAVHASGAARHVWVGDSGDLVTAVDVLGVPHPSGYPLWILLGRAWSELLPLRSLAFELSLFSAATTAVACALFHRLALRLGALGWASLLPPLVVAFAPAIWSQATAQRVYGLNLAFFAAALLLAVRWRTASRRRSLDSPLTRAGDGALVACFLACGLGASNHLFMAVQAVATAAWAVALEPALLRRARTLLASGAAFVAGLLPYAYLPWASRREPPVDWGDPETPERLLAVVTRSAYWPRAWVGDARDAMAAAWHVLSEMPVQLGVAGTALAGLGVVVAALALRGATRPERALRREAALLVVLVAAAGSASVIAHGQWHDLFLFSRYHAPAFAAAALLAGVGAAALLAALPRRLRAVVLIVPLLLFLDGRRAFDRSGLALAEAHARAALISVPAGGRLVAETDSVLFPLLHARHVRGLRADVELVPVGLGRHAPPAPRGDEGDLSLTRFTHRPLTAGSPRRLEAVPVGATWMLRPTDAPPPPRAQAVIWARPLAGEDDPAVLADPLARHLAAHARLTLAATTAAVEDWHSATWHLERALALAHDLPTIESDAGSLLVEHGRPDDALPLLRRALVLDERRPANRRSEAGPNRLRLARVEADAARRRRALAETGIDVATASPAALRSAAAQLERLGAPRWARGLRWTAADREATRAPR